VKRSPMPQRKAPIGRKEWAGAERSRGGDTAVLERPMARALAPAPRATMAARPTFNPQPKPVPVEHEGYRRLVAMLPCICCGIADMSQAAHPNTGKGAGTKTDDRLCFPLCCERSPMRCHRRFDQEAMFTKEERRALEPVWGQRTRERIRDMGLWPTTLAWLESTPTEGAVAW